MMIFLFSNSDRLLPFSETLIVGNPLQLASSSFLSIGKAKFFTYYIQ